MSYYIDAILLQSCPYSISANELLLNLNIESNKIWVNQNNKNNYKNGIINTFPQVYLKKKNTNGSVLIGGYSDLKYFVDNFYKQKYNINNINNTMNKYKMSKKAVLRIIELINSIN